MLIFLISFFSLFFYRCLCCNSSSRMIQAMRCLSLMLVPLVPNRIFTNVGIKCSALHIFRNLISRRVSSYLVLMFSKVLTNVYMSFPCFFLMNVNLLIREYKLTINRHFRPNLVNWNESVYCTPIDRTFKMSFNEGSCSFL